MKKFFLSIACAWSLVGCSSVPELDYPTGKNRIPVNNVKSAGAVPANNSADAQMSKATY